MTIFADLNNERDFPTLGKCPTEYKCHDYYHRRRDPKTWLVDKHWCFLGEIKSVVLSSSREDDHSCTVFDGISTFKILFDLDHPDLFNPDALKVGHTVAIMYAHMYRYENGELGIRADHSDEIMVSDW